MARGVILSRMTKSTREKWAARVREWRASGKSAEEFVADKDFEASSLRWAVSQLGGANALPAAPKDAASAMKRPTAVMRPARPAAPAKSQAPRFAPVRVRRAAAPAAEMVIEVGGARIRVARGADMRLLGEVVSVLQGGSR